MTIEKVIEEVQFNMSHIGLGARAARRVKEAKKIAIQALEEIQEYRAIGTVEELKALKEKSVAKKQGNINDFDSHLKLSKAGFLCCSSTNKDIRYPLISLRDLDYCPRCGQKLDWQ